MPEPINYLAGLQQPDLAGSVMQGLQTGQAIQQTRMQQQAMQQQRDRQAQYKIDLQSALQSPTAQNFAALSVKYPEQREAFKQGWEIQSKEQQDKEFGTGVQAFMALQNGNVDAAKKIVDDHIAGFKNSGLDSADLENVRAALDSDPAHVQAHVGLMLSSIDPERWGKMTDTGIKQDQAPSQLSKSQSEAMKAEADARGAQSAAAKAAVEAKFADSNAVADLQKKGWDITKIQEDIGIAKENSRIAAANVAASRETNELKRQELAQKIKAMSLKRDELVRTKAADVETARNSIDNMLNTADRILKTPMGVVGSAAGPVSSRMPTTSQDTADFEELVNTLGSQAFLAQIPNLKGSGALSDAEGAKLQAALQNFSLRQSPERLVDNVKEAQRLILKARKNLATRYGVPDVIPDTPQANASGNEIDALLQKYGAK